MPSKVEPSGNACRSLALLLAAGACLMAACTTAQPQTEPAPVAIAPAPPPVVEAPPPAPIIVQATPVVAPVLVYADRIRSLQGNELNAEISRLNDATLPADQMRLAIALSQTRQLYDLVRAQELLQRIQANASEEGQRFHSLARLYGARLAEQRRVEDLLDRQGQQLRDTQRRLNETNEKLEALKEIERSLTGRAQVPGAIVVPNPAAQSRNRSRAPQ
ncbi:MAG: hypothetical protein EOO28_05080 [Comamonadaceae bacterium]|nr:MAG: hypothetical protein EOO28_05080 [Comamonadaceae bacterium]